jgi:hypothetical protein
MKASTVVKKDASLRQHDKRMNVKKLSTQYIQRLQVKFSDVSSVVECFSVL